MIGSFYMTPEYFYQEDPWGTPFWQDAPVPGWGVNPLAYEVPRVGVGGLGCNCGPHISGLGQDEYRETSWGMVALAATGGIGLGMMFMHAYHVLKKKN